MRFDTKIAIAVRGDLAAWQKLNQTPLYDVLYTYVIFGASIFYMLAIASVFVLRVKMPDAPRPYRAFGYPVIPTIFLLVTAALLINTFVAAPREALRGVAVLAAGLPFYWYWSSRLR